MVISLDLRRSRRRLRDGSRLPALASNLVAAESEIAAGRIALFTLPKQFWSLLLSRVFRPVPIWTVDGSGDPPPWLSPGTLALCSPDFPLAHRQRPSPRPFDALFTCECTCLDPVDPDFWHCWRRVENPHHRPKVYTNRSGFIHEFPCDECDVGGAVGRARSWHAHDGVPVRPEFGGAAGVVRCMRSPVAPDLSRTKKRRGNTPRRFLDR